MQECTAIAQVDRGKNIALLAVKVVNIVVSFLVAWRRLKYFLSAKTAASTSVLALTASYRRVAFAIIAAGKTVFHQKPGRRTNARPFALTAMRNTMPVISAAESSGAHHLLRFRDGHLKTFKARLPPSMAMQIEDDSQGQSEKPAAESADRVRAAAGFRQVNDLFKW